VEAFIDAGIQTKETLQKWRSRREVQVRKCKLDVPQGLAIIYGDMFNSLGVRVHFSEVDNDDTLAAYAQADGAVVLSGDKDFYRYKQGSFPIYSDFELKNGLLELIESNEFYHPKPRDLMWPLPITHPRYPCVSRLLSTKEYMKGCPSALTKYTGNLHIICRHMRQAFYHAVGIDFPVLESFIDWNSET
jgi:hypothetical protein